MRAGIDLRLYSYRPAGIANYALRLAREFAAMDGITPIVFQSRKTRERLVSAPTRWLWTPCHHRIERFALGAELAFEGMDLFHSPDFIPPVSRGFKRVITVHDLTFRLFPQFLTGESRRYYGQLEQALDAADAVIADSYATRHDLHSEYGYPEDKVDVVHLAPDESFRSLPADIVAEFCRTAGLPDRYILFVGTLEPRKNIDGLLRAMTLLESTLPLVIAGQPGWLYDETLALVDSLGLADRVFFYRPPSFDRLPLVYNAAAVLVLPSFYEGFGFPVLEAMACGVPVVSSNAGSVPELAGDATEVIDPNDIPGIAAAIDHVLANPDHAADLVKRGQVQVKRFSWRKAAEETLVAYRRALV